MLQILFVLWVAASGAAGTASVEALHNEALQHFDAQHYGQAIAAIDEALELDPANALSHFYRGKFQHYQCYDSVPLTGFGRAESDEIVEHLRRATRLDPALGDAFYFLGVEYGARARAELQSGSVVGHEQQLRLGRDAGGYPDWMLEAARNTMRSCLPNALLFVGGDAEANPMYYVQVVEGYRQDIAILPVALLDRPWFVRRLRSGADGVPGVVPLSWSDAQIDALRPFKWQATTVECELAQEQVRAYEVADPIVTWTVEPDLGRGSDPVLLSASRAVITDILLTNRWARPVFSSLGTHQGVWSGLDEHVQQVGFALQLLPAAEEAKLAVERSDTLLMDPASYESVPTFAAHPMPRSISVLENYQVSLVKLAYAKFSSGDVGGAKAALDLMDDAVPSDVVAVPESIRPLIEALRSRTGDATP